MECMASTQQDTEPGKSFNYSTRASRLSEQSVEEQEAKR